jgi:hypothetical protein
VCFYYLARLFARSNLIFFPFKPFFFALQAEPLPSVRGGFVGQASAGVALLRMPLAGGATLGPILEHYANR